MSFYIRSELKRKHKTEFNLSNSKSFYRAVGSGPDVIFNMGFMPALLSRLSYQQGLLNEPYINDSAVTDKNVGWTGGVVSLSDNFLHSAEGIYTTTTGQKQSSRWVYLVTPQETAAISKHLHIGADPVAMDAREVITPCVTKAQVIAAREAKPDGSLGDIVWSPEANMKQQFANSIDFVYFLNAHHLSEIEAQDPQREYNRYSLKPGEAKHFWPAKTLAEQERKEDYESYKRERKAMNEKPLPRVEWEQYLAKSKEERMKAYFSQSTTGHLPSA